MVFPKLSSIGHILQSLYSFFYRRMGAEKGHHAFGLEGVDDEKGRCGWIGIFHGVTGNSVMEFFQGVGEKKRVPGKLGSAIVGKIFP